MTEEDVVYAYHGDFNYRVVNTLLTDIKKQLHRSSPDIRSAKKTYKVLVECLENIHRHSGLNNFSESEKNEGLFVLMRKPKGYVVAIGNSIYESEVESLRTQLDKINSMDRKQLKEHYKNSLLNSTISEKGGAGMGMIDIAIKSGSILEYKFDKFKEDKQFFSLNVLIEDQI